jgi:Tfp pilus assembly protein PilN
MIKVNLALKKHGVGIVAREKGSSFNLSALSSGLNTDFLRDPLFRKVGLVVVVAIMATYLLSGFKDDEVQKLDDVLTKTNAVNAKISAELAKTKGYEDLKKQIDADETTLRTKLNTIKKLIVDRQIPPKLLTSLSSGIPGDLWLSELSMDEKELRIKGFALGYTQITDLLKTLGESEFLVEPKLVDSKQTKDGISGQEMANFELSAKKK